jgi:hypothetical protein
MLLGAESEMVQPYNYQMAGIQSPFESVVQGLKLGATLESLQLEREKQRQAMALAEQKAAEQRQNQEFMTGFFGRVSAGETPNSADWLRIGTMLQPEQVKMAENIRQQMGDRQQFNTGSNMARLATALWRNPEIADQEFENLIQANPNDAPGLQRLRQIAKTDPRGAAVMVYGIGLGMGGRIAEAVKGLPDLLGMKATDGFQVITADQAKSLGLPPGNTYQRNASTGKIETITTAGRSFEVVSRAEAEKLGLPAGAYKREIGTGEISAIGPGGTNITLKTEGSIPEGYRAIRDSQGNLMSYEPVPGSPAAAKAQAEVAAQQARAEGKTQQAGIVSQDIQRLVAALDSEESLSGAARLDPRNYVTGIPGKAAEKLPGSARIAAQGFVDSIKASIGFDRLDQMRQESPTGGALGNITEQELRFLQATLGSIDLDSKPEVLRQNLRRLQTIYENIMRKAAEYPNAAKFGFSAAAQGQVGGATVQPAPGGAVMEPVVRPPAPPAPPASTPSPAGAAPPARGGTSLGGGFKLLD